MRDRWGPEQDAAFALMKEKVADTRLLRHHDPSKEYYLMTDASVYAWGAVLLQKHTINGEDRLLPVEFLSKKFSDAPENGVAANWNSTR